MKLTGHERETIQRVLNNPYIPHTPTQKQWEFLMAENKDVFFGGAAGPGKTDALLMAALMYVDESDYAAILFRRTFTNLTKANSLIPRSKKWLKDTDASWNGKDHTWTFPSGATLEFGHMQYEDDRFNYNSAEYQFIGFDEICEFLERQYTFLFSRLRRTVESDVPLRFRAAGNPIGPGFEWVKARYVDQEVTDHERVRIPASLEDNPHVRREEYRDSLSHLDPITQEKVMNGSWEIAEEGEKFKRAWFDLVDEAPKDARRVRYWDLASTAEKGDNDPDWTAGALLAMKDGRFWLDDIKHFRADDYWVEKTVKQTAQLDNQRYPNVLIRMEREPGSAGKSLIGHYRRDVLVGFAFDGDRVTGPKTVRANPVASAAKAGNLKLVKGGWNDDFIREAVKFPSADEHDDQIDALSGAHNALADTSGYTGGSPGS